MLILLGEGDFSFARALGVRIAAGDVQMDDPIVATEFGSPDDVCKRYFAGSKDNFHAQCSKISEYGILLVFDVDATRLCDAEMLCRVWQPDEGCFEERPFWSLFAASSISKVIFNFPHTAKHGKTTKMLRLAFRNFRRCIVGGQLAEDCLIEMRLRHVSQSNGLIRSQYDHEEAAAATGFDLVSVRDSDLDEWCKAGYEHRATKKNARAGHLELVKTWLWRALLFKMDPRQQPIPEGSPRSLFYAVEAVSGNRLQKSPYGRMLKQFLIKWRGYSEESNTWELAKDLDSDTRKRYEKSMLQQGISIFQRAVET